MSQYSAKTPELPIKIMFFSGAEKYYTQSGGPVQATPGAAGFDLRAMLDEPVVIAPGMRHPVKTGIALEPLHPGVAAFVFSRSGLGAVKGLTVAQGVGIIDPDYRGEITVFLLNTSPEPQTVAPADRIAQMVFMPFFQPVFETAASLGETARGSGGFGHTGIK